MSSVNHIPFTTTHTKHKKHNRVTILSVVEISLYLHIKQAPLSHHFIYISWEKLKHISNYSFFDLNNVISKSIYLLLQV